MICVNTLNLPLLAFSSLLLARTSLQFFEGYFLTFSNIFLVTFRPNQDCKIPYLSGKKNKTLRWIIVKKSFLKKLLLLLSFFPSLLFKDGFINCFPFCHVIYSYSVHLLFCSCFPAPWILPGHNLYRLLHFFTLWLTFSVGWNPWGTFLGSPMPPSDCKC